MREDGQLCILWYLRDGKKTDLMDFDISLIDLRRSIFHIPCMSAGSDGTD